MHRHITAAAAFLVCLVWGTFAADAETYRNASGPGWTKAGHWSANRLPARRVLSERRPTAWYSSYATRGSSPTMPTILKPPGMTVLNRQYLDDINATTFRDLRYTPGVIAR
jgi:hypothetical protein